MSKLIPITIPKWGIEMEHGTISEWRVAAGASVVKGDEIVDIETDKIVNSFEAAHDGVLVRILAEEGEDILVHKLSRADALELLARDRVPNGHTLIALQWLQLHGDSLRERWGAAAQG